ncbi:MAG: site-2 protease family protein [Saprospiraceae bacterium]|nr:site-2 protease family protein [Saprospiraceae bacterium]MBK7525295.1 site-2 protease family protein [Saprospiraceae bacterium]MBK8370315.1 site-2 protease family protein [Saprospiraceae bacterium]MBK8817798.1 site-2 protease family protein [Saprospiraceae bacterium]MBK8854740.1 site-2 protease family protein [Saprospiraceae bacterium]
MGTFWQIPVKIHWTFGLLLSLLVFSAYKNGFSLHQTIGFVLFFLCVFICVVFHEFGHALMARKFNVTTKDIILSPIGGVARLDNLPKNPFQELMISFAGPAVNLAIAAILIPILHFGFDTGWPRLDDFKYDKPVEFFKYLAFVNIGLFIFNLVPAFPMDGGRILRSVLAMQMDKVKATKIASLVGKVIAILFIIIGVFFQVLSLSLIGIFIFLMAGLEYKSLRMNELMKTTKASDIMKTQFSMISPEDSYEKIIQLYTTASEKNFLVFAKGNDVIGCIPELYIKDVLKRDNKDILVKDLINLHFGIFPSYTSLEQLMTVMKEKGLSIVGVEEDQMVVGVIDRNLLQNFIILKNS